MRIKLFFIVFLTMSFALSSYGQVVHDKPGSTPTDDESLVQDDKKVYFYSEAEMYVGFPKDESTNKLKNSTTMLVAGSAKFADGALIDQKGKTELKGDFISAIAKVDKSGGGKKPMPLFTNVGDIQVDGKDVFGGGIIAFTGQNNKQSIIREFPTGSLEPQERKNYYQINFPTVKVDKIVNAHSSWFVKTQTEQKASPLKKSMINVGFLDVDTTVAVRMANLELLNGNRFVANVGAEQASNSEYKLNSSYVHIDKLTDNWNTGTTWDSGTSSDIGSCQVNLFLHSEGGAKSKENAVNVTYTVTGNDPVPAYYLRGVSSPFENLGTDYFFYQVLTAPSSKSITDEKGPLANPKTDILEGGRGYFLASEVTDIFKDRVFDKWFEGSKSTIANADDAVKGRNVGFFALSRRMAGDEYFTDKRDGFNQHKTIDKSKIKERFNTGNVKVVMKSKGMNFLGNPYMTPISLKGLLGTKQQVTDGDEFLPTAGIKLYKSAPGDVMITSDILKNHTGAKVRPAYWLVNQGLVVPFHKGTRAFFGYNVQYDIVAYNETPGTAIDMWSQILIDPMQMFVVQTNTEGITFEFCTEAGNDIRTIDGIKYNQGTVTAPANGPKAFSTRADAVDGSEIEDNVTDWFVVEAADESGKLIDRTAVRFFDTATKSYDDKHDIVKQVIRPRTNDATRVADDGYVGADSGEEFTSEKVMFTETEDGRSLLANGIPYSTKEVPLHYLPSAQAESVTISAAGLERFDRIEGVWLVDKFENKITKLEDGVKYQFVSEPLANKEKVQNRFILRFYDDGDEPVVNDEGSISCYYSGSVLHIAGLNEGDLGSSVQIFDLQGRLMGKTTVNNYPSMEYTKPLGLGTFVVKISGNRNYTTKFVNVQNY